MLNGKLKMKGKSDFPFSPQLQLKCRSARSTKDPMEKSTYFRSALHCIKSELYLAKWKWILRSGPKLKMLVKSYRSNGSFPNLLNWWRIRFGCSALDQCYWNKENWFANWKFTMHFSPRPQHKIDKQFCAHREIRPHVTGLLSCASDHWTTQALIYKLSGRE